MSEENTNLPVKSEPVVLNPIKQVESSVGNVSVRGIIAFILVLALCIMPFCKIPIPQEISSLAIAVCAFYFGKNQSK